MNNGKSSFAVFIGNRGFFPASLLAEGREEMAEVLEGLGHKVLMLDAAATRHGAVESAQEGEVYANFLRQNAGKYDGVVVCLPNFGDETGAVAALQEAGVPILIQAYPDELNQMAPEKRRDAFCGKMSIMDMLCQYGTPFTALKPHTVHPRSPRFASNIDYFDRLCRVVKGMKSLVVGAIGARTTAFKTVRIDEIALQQHGITMETLDLADIFARVAALSSSDAKVKAKTERLKDYTSWAGVPDSALETLAKLGVVFDDVVDEYHLDACAIRCWVEMQKQLKISPCVLLSEMNDRGVIAACEVDVGNAVTMRALSLASGDAATCLDWNNNYGEEDDKCILFHCGPVPQSMMVAKGQITDHAILANAVGCGCGYGCNAGRIAPTPFTFGSLLTQKGGLKFYLGQGRFIEDPIPGDFFGCAGVAQIDNLQDTLQTIGSLGHRHHVSVTPGHTAGPVQEAFEKYLGYEVTPV
jgi:L-fucose isomerase-like protein